LADSADNGSNEGAAALVGICIRCCLSSLLDVLSYINALAYANMAISGDKYCTSAWNGFMLNLRHIGKFSLAQIIGGFLAFVGILFISFVSTGIFYALVMNEGEELVPITIFVFVSCIVISRTFLGLFDDAIMATLQCVAIDMDLNNGVPKFGSASFQKSIK